MTAATGQPRRPKRSKRASESRQVNLRTMIHQNPFRSACPSLKLRRTSLSLASTERLSRRRMATETSHGQRSLQKCHLRSLLSSLLMGSRIASQNWMQSHCSREISRVTKSWKNGWEMSRCSFVRSIRRSSGSWPLPMAPTLKCKTSEWCPEPRA